MKILIADDDEIALELLRNVLESFGHEVQTARDGVEALESLRSGACRLLISDWEMPRMSGVELCRRIRSEELPGYVYVFLLTSHSTREDVIEGLSAGADDFLTKPFQPQELSVRLRTAERILSLETRDVAIFAMAKLAESRDPETGAHLERVRGYSRVLAQHLREAEAHPEIDQEFVRLIYLTSPLHDIGKVGIPDGVLLKPGRLSDREFEMMKSHTTLGSQTLEAALAMFPGAGFLKMARDIAISHHERFDGTGYPNGLKAADIPLCGRIVAVADVYDALTSKRVYKGAFHHDVARSIIAGESGTHFDPALVNAFLACEEKFRAIQERYGEAQQSPRAA